jgi:Cu/Ag efflux pump CusA
VPKIIREKYENGVLVERQTEGSNTTHWHWLMLAVHTVIAITLVLSSVFIPTAFLAGITGQFYRQFALTIAISTVISAINWRASWVNCAAE